MADIEVGEGIRPGADARARGRVTRRTPSSPAASNSLARSWINEVMSDPAGPPSGGLYLKPPSRGGLWLGVTTMPSARPGSVVERPALWRRMAWDTAGVGVSASRESMATVTPCAASTSRAVAHAGWLSA